MSSVMNFVNMLILIYILLSVLEIDRNSVSDCLVYSIFKHPLVVHLGN